MNRLLPRFEPPTRPQQQQPTFPAYLKQIEDWLDRYQKYTFDFVNQLVDVANTGAQGFSLNNLVAAPTIQVDAYTTLVTGAGPISTINTSPGFSGQIHLIAVDGFTTVGGGNIASVVTVAADMSCLFDFNPVSGLWYPNVGN